MRATPLWRRHFLARGKLARERARKPVKVAHFALTGHLAIRTPERAGSFRPLCPARFAAHGLPGWHTLPIAGGGK